MLAAQPDLAKEVVFDIRAAAAARKAAAAAAHQVRCWFRPPQALSQSFSSHYIAVVESTFPFSAITIIGSQAMKRGSSVV